MRLPFVTRRRHEAALAVVQDRLDKALKDLDGARHGRKYVTWQRDDLARQLEECHARVGRRDAQIAAMTDRRFDNSDAVTRLERRLKALQARYDDAVGLTSDGIKDSREWQRGFVPPKPDPKPEVAS